MVRLEARLATICARGGSRGVPGKNTRLLLGRPLIAHTILQARSSRLFQLVAVSSDSPDVLDAAASAGADLLIVRPPELASDTAAKMPAIQHAARTAEAQSGQKFATMVDLDATSPLRAIDDIVNAVALLEGSDADNVITACPAHRSPYFNLIELDSDGRPQVVCRGNGGLVVRRQDSPACFDMNASIYAWRRDALLGRGAVFSERTRLYVMPRERSIDIDEELDFSIVEILASRRPDMMWEPYG